MQEPVLVHVISNILFISLNKMYIYDAIAFKDVIVPSDYSVGLVDDKLSPKKVPLLNPLSFAYCRLSLSSTSGCVVHDNAVLLSSLSKDQFNAILSIMSPSQIYLPNLHTGHQPWHLLASQSGCLYHY
jgi:hypothetical protein